MRTVFEVLSTNQGLPALLIAPGIDHTRVFYGGIENIVSRANFARIQSLAPRQATTMPAGHEQNIYTIGIAAAVPEHSGNRWNDPALDANCGTIGNRAKRAGQ